MPIRIEEINAKGLGPLDEFEGVLGDINLVYGRNERGKTFLVEFLLKSLFKNLKVFNLRSVEASGTVLVSGLADETQRFSPKSRKKIEEYWEQSNPGMPPNMARLLVVKGADLSLEDTAQRGVSRAIIRSFLSGEVLLDHIQGKIQKTIRDAQIENGRIEGANRGEISEHAELRKKIRDLDDLIERMDQELSGGDRAARKTNLVKLERSIADQREAKRYKAFGLNEDLNRQEEQLRQFRQNGLEDIVSQRDEYLRSVRDIEKKEEELQELKENSQHYEWLEKAIVEYEKRFQQGGKRSGKISLILMGLSYFSGIALTTIAVVLPLFADAPMGLIIGVIGVAAILTGLFFTFLYIRQYRKEEASSAGSDEINRIGVSFKERFGEQLADLAALKAQLERTREAYFSYRSKSDEIEKLREGNRHLEGKILNWLSRFGTQTTDDENWVHIVNRLEYKHDECESRSNELKIALANLDVAPEDYLEAYSGIEYSKVVLERAEKALFEENTTLQEEEQSLALLEREIRSVLNDKDSDTLDELVGNLRSHRMHIVQQYQEITGGILAKILLVDVIKQAREKEDEKIKTDLDSPAVLGPLLAITNRYESIALDGENIKVLDKHDEFELADLSTGTHEQVLLALRIGFATRIMGRESSFLILDDAFQHSDWERRERLLEVTMYLAKQGWQILYFTMDDHIRHLFNDVCKPKFKGNYKEFVL